jgi:hypothetical protein
MVVNHSEGFITSDGIHTNNIENVWSRLKSEMSRYRGVKRTEIEPFLEKFTYRQYNINENDLNEFHEVFFRILKYLLTNCGAQAAPPCQTRHLSQGSRMNTMFF